MQSIRIIGRLDDHQPLECNHLLCSYDMPKNPGYVTDQGFPNSVKGLLEEEWEILLKMDVFIRWWISEEKQILNIN